MGDTKLTSSEPPLTFQQSRVDAVMGKKKNRHFLTIFIPITIVILLIIGLLVYQQMHSKQTLRAETKIYHIGVLSALDYFYPTVEGFKKKMTEQGYLEGKNVVYEVERSQMAIGNQKIIRKFVEDKVDLILVFPTEASLEAKDVTKGSGIPIISTGVFVEGNGLVNSIPHPGGTITGVRFPVLEIAAKRLEILHQLAPHAKRVWIPYLKDYPTAAPAIKVLVPLAASYGLTLSSTEFATPDEMAAYFAAQNTKDHSFDAVLLIPEPIALVPAFLDQIYSFADAHSIPVGGASVQDSDHGALFSLIPNSLEFGRLAAPLADKIFRGMPAGSIPIVTAESDFEINYRAIQKLGLTVDEGLLSRAVRIIR